MKKEIFGSLLVIAIIAISGCIQPPACGNGVCEAGETHENCPIEEGGDCPPTELCGNGICNTAQGENQQNCPQDCGEQPPPQPVCGNGVIEAGEQCDGNDDVCGEGFECDSSCECVPVEEPPEPFQPSEVICEENQETGKLDACYCQPRVQKEKVAIVIKLNGVYDEPNTIAVFNLYFSAIQSSSGLANAGVKKFSGNSKPEFEQFVDNIFESQGASYFILVGSDLPITYVEGGEDFGDYSTPEVTFTDIHFISDKLQYFGRDRVEDSGTQFCADMAFSIVVAPRTYSAEEKRNFVSNTFNNFIRYHENFEAETSKFEQKILAVDWDNSIEYNAPVGGWLDPERWSEYNRIYFYPLEYLLNTQHDQIKTEFEKSPLQLFYEVHGAPTDLGLGLQLSPPQNRGEITTLNYELNEFMQSNNIKILVVNSYSACQQNAISTTFEEEFNRFCCWPQTWLNNGAWFFYTVYGGAPHYNFELALNNRKFVGKALKETYNAGQNTIFGDIAAHLKR